MLLVKKLMDHVNIFFEEKMVAVHDLVKKMAR